MGNGKGEMAVIEKPLIWGNQEEREKDDDGIGGACGWQKGKYKGENTTMEKPLIWGNEEEGEEDDDGIGG